MHDYERRDKAAAPKDSIRLVEIAAELETMAERLRAIGSELALSPALKKLIPREFRQLYDDKRAVGFLETAAVKTDQAAQAARDGARLVSTYEG